MTHFDWSKAPADATHARIDDFRFPWRMLKNGIWHAWHGNWITVTSSDHSLYAERPSPVWNGKGNPPSGVLIEMLHAGCSKWQEITPLHIGTKLMLFERYAGEEVIEEVLPLSAIQLRPIRTAEQIATDEREAALKQMIALVGGSSRRSAEALYDAGYRLQVAP